MSTPSADYLSGYDINITDGIIRARYRNAPDRPAMMKAGEVHEITVDPASTDNLFRKGHRIRVDLSSSNFPQSDVNPNTGEPLGRNLRQQKANNTIWHRQAKPSYIVLLIIEK